MAEIDLSSLSLPHLDFWEDGFFGVHPQPSLDLAEPMWSKEECLRHVLDLFPDVAHDYVGQIFDIHRPHQRNDQLCTRILEDIMSNTKYPKQRDQLAKEKQLDENRIQELLKGSLYPRLVLCVLKQEFGNMPVATIKSVVRSEETLDKAFAVLSGLSNATETLSSRRASKRRKQDNSYLQDYPTILTQHVHEELEKAKSKLHHDLNASSTELPAATSATVIVECGCCFSDVPEDKTVQCSGDSPHSFCIDCAATNVRTDIGAAKCRPKCMDISDCKAPFAEHQLRLCLDPKTMSHLIRLQQQEDLKAAGIEGLEDCPFCDYMDVCQSICIDREFRCQNEGCGKVSCRMCHFESHIPLTCHQAAIEREKDRKIDARHVLEEAMTEALIRTCNKQGCKTKFIKIDGCNSMHCPKCRNHQCYVCSQNIHDYNHFGVESEGKCPLHDQGGVEVRHHADVKKAEEAARAKIQAQKPDIEADDLDFKVSEEVKKAQEYQRQHGRAADFGYYPGVGMQHRPQAVDPRVPNEGRSHDAVILNRIRVIQDANAHAYAHANRAAMQMWPPAPVQLDNQQRQANFLERTWNIPETPTIIPEAPGNTEERQADNEERLQQAHQRLAKARLCQLDRMGDLVNDMRTQHNNFIDKRHIDNTGQILRHQQAVTALNLRGRGDFANRRNTIAFNPTRRPPPHIQRPYDPVSSYNPYPDSPNMPPLAPQPACRPNEEAAARKDYNLPFFRGNPMPINYNAELPAQLPPPTSHFHSLVDVQQNAELARVATDQRQLRQLQILEETRDQQLVILAQQAQQRAQPPPVEQHFRPLEWQAPPKPSMRRRSLLDDIWGSPMREDGEAGPTNTNANANANAEIIDLTLDD